MLELYLARQLVKPIFTILLAIGALIGVACFLMVSSLMRNYVVSLEELFTGLHPHVEVSAEQIDDETFSVLKEQIRAAHEEVQQVRPAIYQHIELHYGRANRYRTSCRAVDGGPVCAATAGADLAEAPLLRRTGFELNTKGHRPYLLKGIDFSAGPPVLRLDSILQASFGDYQRLTQTENTNGQPIARGFYAEGLPADDMLEHYLLGTRLGTGADPEAWQHFRLLGLLDLGRQKGSEPLVLMALPVAQDLLGVRSFNTVEVALRTPGAAETVAAAIAARIGDDYSVTSWIAQERESFAFLATVRTIAFVLISSISLVAAIGVYSTLSLAVMQNRQKIAILMALGLSRRRIYLVFLSSAWVIALIGLVLGSLTGVLGSEQLLLLFQDELARLGIQETRTLLGAPDLLQVAVFVLVLFSLTAWMPARRAANLDPIDNLTGN